MPGRASSEEARAATSGRVLATIAVTVVAMIGLALRLWAIGRAPIDADQAVVGLMAREIAHGHFFAIFWGQRYGGVEPYVVALVFLVFGQSAFTLALAPVLLDVVAVVLLWRIGSRLFSPAVGIGAALLFWIWPEADLQLATMEFGFRFVTLVCGLSVLLLALRLSMTRPDARRQLIGVVDWVLFGVLVGIGWWSSPEIAYYAVPALGLLLSGGLRQRLPRPLLGGPLAVISAGIGALPWLWYDAGHHFDSLQQRRGLFGAFGSHLSGLARFSLPMLLGLRLRGDGSWIVSPTVGRILYGVVLAALVGVLAVLVVRREALVLVAFVPLAAVEYASAPTGDWHDGRYAMYFAPVVALFVVKGCTLVSSLAARGAPVRATELVGGAVAVVLGLALTVGAATAVAPFRPTRFVTAASSWGSWRSDPDTVVAPVVGLLRAREVRDLYAGYWVGPVVAFASRGAIVTTDVPFVRYPPFTEAVEGAPRTAWLFLGPGARAHVAAELGTALVDPACVDSRYSCLEPGAFERYLVAHHDAFVAARAGDFLVIFPTRAVAIGDLRRHLPMRARRHVLRVA